MGEYPAKRETTVIVDEEGVLARWADWQSRSKNLPIAAIASEPGDAPMMFVANEILVDAEERDLIEQLLGEGATVVPQPPLKPPPHGLERRELTGEFPMPVRLQFAEPPRIEQAAERLTDLYRQYEAARGTVTVTSEGAAHVAALVGRLVAEGRQVGLNAVGNTTAMPLAGAEEGQGKDPFSWSQLTRWSRIVDAWQLIESVRAVNGWVQPVWIAILDGGFCLNPDGTPWVSPKDSASDFGSGVIRRVNLIDEEAPVGDPNPTPASGGGSSPWHGNATASAALAAVNNKAGAAGSGGTVAYPVFFHSTFTASQIFRCIHYCAAWGLDVLNMSFAIEGLSPVFISLWDKVFNFAVANGVVMVTGAGNGDEDLIGQELPDWNVRPATRTPGVITVAALDGKHDVAPSVRAWPPGSLVVAAPSSNYGSSVSVWAPGSLPVAPDKSTENHEGRVVAGTSIASPIVAGVAAMMRAVNPKLDSVAVRQILVETAWPGEGRVTRGLDAYAAVLRAMGGRLPADLSEPNNTPATAKELFPDPGGILKPSWNGISSLSGDPDFYKFRLTTFSEVTVTAEWYPLLGNLRVLIEAEDPEVFGPEEMTPVTGPGTLTMTGHLPAGMYRLEVRGSANNAYRLEVKRTPAKVPADAFEPNDTFETATRLLFKQPKGTFGVTVGTGLGWGPGAFRATLHSPRAAFEGVSFINPDFYRLEVPESSVFAIPTVTITRMDAPLDVTLYDAAQREIQSWPNVRKPLSVIPPERSTCFLKISGTTVNRYTITTLLKVKKDAIPPPRREELEIFPKWWGDDVRRFTGLEKHFVVNVGERGDGTSIRFAPPEEAMRIELLDLEGNVVREAAEGRAGMEIDTRDLHEGRYLVRLTREDGADARRPVMMRLLPPRR